MDVLSADGKAAFRNRAYKFTNSLTTTQATFSNSGSDLPYTDVQVSFDDNEVINNDIHGQEAVALLSLLLMQILLQDLQLLTLVRQLSIQLIVMY